MGTNVTIDSEVLATLCDTIYEDEAVQIARDALTAAGLDPETGREVPLTVGGEPVDVTDNSFVYWRAGSHLPVPLDWALKNATPAELARLRKALGVEQNDNAATPQGEGL